MMERFWSKVYPVPHVGCWLWTAARIKSNGYGRFRHPNGETVYAHRMAYELAKGPIPEGMTIDHLCRTRACVNPDHLEAVSHRTNTLRGMGPTAKHARKTHCVNGHPYTPENTYIRPDGTGKMCKVCQRNRDRDRK